MTHRSGWLLAFVVALVSGSFAASASAPPACSWSKSPGSREVTDFSLELRTCPYLRLGLPPWLPPRVCDRLEKDLHLPFQDHQISFSAQTEPCPILPTTGFVSIAGTALRAGGVTVEVAAEGKGPSCRSRVEFEEGSSAREVARRIAVAVAEHCDSHQAVAGSFYEEGTVVVWNEAAEVLAIRLSGLDGTGLATPVKQVEYRGDLSPFEGNLIGLRNQFSSATDAPYARLVFLGVDRVLGQPAGAGFRDVADNLPGWTNVAFLRRNLLADGGGGYWNLLPPHELGHVLLNTSEHSRRRSALMYPTPVHGPLSAREVRRMMGRVQGRYRKQADVSEELCGAVERDSLPASMRDALRSSDFELIAHLIDRSQDRRTHGTATDPGPFAPVAFYPGLLCNGIALQSLDQAAMKRFVSSVFPGYLDLFGVPIQEGPPPAAAVEVPEAREIVAWALIGVLIQRHSAPGLSRGSDKPDLARYAERLPCGRGLLPGKQDGAWRLIHSTTEPCLRQSFDPIARRGSPYLDGGGHPWILLLRGAWKRAGCGAEFRQERRRLRREKPWPDPLNEDYIHFLELLVGCPE